MPDTCFPSLPDGYYRFIRTREGKVFWAFPNSNIYHTQLVENNRLNKEKVLSAGFFEVRGGEVSLPKEVPTIDSEDKSNRSLGLRLSPRWFSGSVSDDLTLILQTLEEEVI